MLEKSRLWREGLVKETRGKRQKGRGGLKKINN